MWSAKMAIYTDDLLACDVGAPKGQGDRFQTIYRIEGKLL